MRIEFDPRKNERNVRERGLSFEQVAEFDFESAAIVTVNRNGELRRVSVGYLAGRLHVICYKPLHDGIRVISFRKANEQEAKKYGKPKYIAPAAPD